MKIKLVQCNLSKKCKSKNCIHVLPHTSCLCQRPAPCGNWPENADFKPMVKCVATEDVVPLEDCPYCGEKEAKGHHFQNCLENLKKENKELKAIIGDVQNSRKSRYGGITGGGSMIFYYPVEEVEEALAGLGKLSKKNKDKQE